MIDINTYDLIVFYCANYSCTAAKNYASTILKENPELAEKSILYEGGLLEWSSLALTCSFLNTLFYIFYT